MHLVAHTLTDLSRELASVGQREAEQEAVALAERLTSPPTRQPTKVRDICIPDLTLNAIRVRTRNFR